MQSQSRVATANRARQLLQGVRARQQRQSGGQSLGGNPTLNLDHLWLPRKGQQLLPQGRAFGQTGAPLRTSRQTCGTPTMARLLGKLGPQALAQLDPPGREPDGPWFGQDLRRACCSPKSPVNGKPIPRYVLPAGEPGPDFAAMMGARSRRLPTGGTAGGVELGTEGAVTVSADDDPLEHDGRPEVTVGGAGEEEEVVCPPVPLGAAPADPLVRFEPNGLADQGGREWINLGRDSLGTRMRAYVPASYTPGRSKSEMLAAFIPDWQARCAPAGEADFEMAHRCLDYDSTHTPGLFWNDGWGFYHRALLYAVLTLHGYRKEAVDFGRMANTCDIDEATIEHWVEDKRRWVKSSSDACDARVGWMLLYPDGRVQAGRQYDSFSAWAFDGKVRLCAKVYKVEAALADYYLYWAHRLYSYYMDGCGTAAHYELGYWCARAALSEIVELACILLHELSHLTGSLFHCSPDVAPVPSDYPLADLDGSDVGDIAAGVVGALVGLLILLGTVASAAVIFITTILTELVEELAVDSGDPPQDCCQYGLQGAFRWRLWAALGCPPGHLYDGAKEDQALARFADYDPSWHTAKAVANSFGDACVQSGPNMDGSIWYYLTPGSPGTFQWSIPADCSSMSPPGGSEGWTS